MLNPFAEINWNPTRDERRKFALSLVIGFPCVALALFLLGQVQFPAALRLGGAGAGAGVLLWVAPGIARPFYVVWYFLACCMGLVLGNLLLAGFFYFVLTPFGLARRGFGRPAFRRRSDRQAPTYWKEAGPPPEPERYYKQF
jgi:hypothetical protein